MCGRGCSDRCTTVVHKYVSVSEGGGGRWRGGGGGGVLTCLARRRPWRDDIPDFFHP